MSIINNSHAIGVDTRNLVLKTRGSLHVKVGDAYYEIDFRNLGKKDEDDEQFIIPINTKDEIDIMDYPGDNRFIVGLDGSFFITKDKTIIEVTPKQKEDIPKDSESGSLINSEDKTSSLQTSLVEGVLYGPGSARLDFVNEEFTINTLTVTNSISFPNTHIKNICCKSSLDVKKYIDKDFVELVTENESLVFKSGVIVKSSIDKIIPTMIGTYSKEVQFSNGGLYVLYIDNDELVYTKLN